MGSLHSWNLSTFNCPYFIETGTGLGTSLLYAKKFNFTHLYSIEIDSTLANIAKAGFSNSKNITIINNSSLLALPTILKSIPKSKPILFWLDAHFPKSDYFTHQYTINEDNMPLEKEINIITSLRNTKNDSFIIDDARLYIDANFQHGNINIPKNASFLNKFIHHNTLISTKHEGYITITPKSLHA